MYQVPKPSKYNRRKACNEEGAKKKPLRKKIKKYKLAKCTKKKHRNTKPKQRNTDPDANAHEQKQPAQDLILYKQMAQDYWDWWQWEVCQRKKEIGERHAARSKSLHQIDPSHLSDPIQDGKTTEAIIGRGSFSIVQLKVYRGMLVAVKQFRTQSLKEDVLNEALHLNAICHPCLPHLFGVCTTAPPHRIVTQFHGIDGRTVTLQREIHHRQVITTYMQWMILCTHLL